MHNFPLLFLCEKEKNQNTSDMYCKKHRKMLDYAHRHKTSDKYIKELAKRIDMSDEKRKIGKSKHKLFFRNETMKRRAVRFRGMTRIFAQNNQNKYTGR